MAAGDIIDDGLWAFDPSALDWSNLPTIQVFNRNRTPCAWWSRVRAAVETPSEIGCASENKCSVRWNWLASSEDAVKGWKQRVLDS